MIVQKTKIIKDPNRLKYMVLTRNREVYLFRWTGKKEEEVLRCIAGFIEDDHCLLNTDDAVKATEILKGLIREEG